MKKLELVLGIIALILVTFTVTVLAKPDITPVVNQPNVYSWTELNPQDFKEAYPELPIEKISVGHIVTGYTSDNIPITRQGVQITFSRELTPTEANNIDIDMSCKGLYRESGATVRTELEQIKTEITK